MPPANYQKMFCRSNTGIVIYSGRLYDGNHSTFVGKNSLMKRRIVRFSICACMGRNTQQGMKTIKLEPQRKVRPGGWDGLLIVVPGEPIYIGSWCNLS